ncbi:TPR-like protein [Meira miltonrushii]|uniref:Tetratricopeptide repeat and J domain-containing co-chaperone DNJ1 n=1 Tax=Meira miltonrushii TaxID=1280837 RepID=A0A316VHH1_9BASI|nr:TPR-like protein [Meira miltonrushii]PWN37042.1 TPR-like protein [Meira miltonrushii]
MRFTGVRLTAASLLLISIALALASVSTALAQENAQVPLDGEDGGTLSAAELLKKGTASMTRGKFADAIDHFDQAIEQDPKNYLSYYRRATASLSLGRSSSALADFDKIITLNPSFAQAHFQRASLLTKEGDLEEAKSSIKEYLKLKKDDEEAKELQKTIDATQSTLKSLRKTKEAVDKSIKAGKDAKKDSSLAAKLDDCIRFAGQILEASPTLLEARRARADCALYKGEVQDAMADWTRIANLSPSPSLLLRLSSLSYFVFGEQESQGREAGLAHLKACLNSDPDNKRCAKAHRRLRNIEKALKKAKNFSDANSWRAMLSALKGAKVGGPTVMQEVQKAIEDDLKVVEGDQESVLPASLHDAVQQSALLFELNELHCRAHTELEEIKKAMPYCNKVLERDEDNRYGRVARAEQHMEADEFEEAVRDLRKAFEASNKQDQKIHAKLQKAEKKLKLSKSKDYYKVLGVPKNVDEKALKKAYRAKARENHPDKGGSPEKMAEINEAFDVLKDPELRARFDAGDDPNDPMGGHQGGAGNPFAQGFGGQQFFFQQGGFQSGGFPGGQFHFQF